MRPPCSVNQVPLSGRNYPFLSPSGDVEGVLGDFYLSFAGDAASVAWPLSVARLYGFGAGAPSGAHPNARDVLVTDAGGAVVFDSSSASYRESAWGAYRKVCQWVTASGVCRAVAYSDAEADTPALLEPGDGRLDPRTCVPAARRVHAMKADGTGFSGEVELGQGHNTRVESAPAVAGLAVFAPQSAPLRNESYVDFHAVPGAGLGVVERCGEPAVLRSLGGATARNGNVAFDLGDCLRLQRAGAVSGPPGSEVFTPAGAAFSLHNDCENCCKCPDFARVYKALARLWGDGKSAALAAQQTASALRRVKTRYEFQKGCNEVNVLKASLTPSVGFTASAGAAFCNSLGACVAPLMLRFSFIVTKGASDLTTACGGALDSKVLVNGITPTGESPYAPAGAWPVFDVYLDRCDPRTASTVRFKVKMPTARENATLRMLVTAHTDSPALPTLDTVPPEFIALWESAGLDPYHPLGARVAVLESTSLRFGTEFVPGVLL